MELTRLRRVLRTVLTATYSDAQDVLDAVDEVYEDAEEYEQWLRDSIVPEEGAISDFVGNSASRLVHSLVSMESIGVSGILDAMLTRTGYEQLVEEIEIWKQRLDSFEENPFDE